MIDRTCSTMGCDRPHYMHGLCQRCEGRERYANAELCTHPDCTAKQTARGLCRKHWELMYAPPCSIDGCDKPQYAKGWCNAHWANARRTGNPIPNKPAPAVCLFDGCPTKVITLVRPGYGWCKKHWRRIQAHGDPAVAKADPRNGRPTTCTVPGCDAPYLASGLCVSHYKQSKTYHLTRRARKLNAPGSHTAAEWRVLVDEYDGRCAYCGSAGKMTRDHVVPLSRGGSDDIDNIVPACPTCNSSKGDRTLDEWN